MTLSKGWIGRNSPSGAASSVVVTGLTTTGYTHAIVVAKHEGADGTSYSLTNSDSDTGVQIGTQQTGEGIAANDLWVIMFVIPLSSPGSSKSFTASWTGGNRNYREIAVWGINSTVGTIEVNDTIQGSIYSYDDPKVLGDLVTDAATVCFAYFAGYISGLTWTATSPMVEDDDTDNNMKQSYTSTGSETISVSAADSLNSECAVIAVAMSEVTGGGGGLIAEPFLHSFAVTRSTNY